MTTSIPIPQRKNDAFLSHAHEDKAGFVEPLKRWLDSAGIRVFYDREALIGDIETTIQHEIGNSRAGIVAWSKAARKAAWVQDEYKHFRQQEREFRDFQIVGLNLDGSLPEDLPSAVNFRRWIACDKGFGPEEATILIESLYSHESRPDLFEMRPVYMARGSRPGEVAKANAVTGMLARHGIRVVRDAPHQNFDRNRICDIMRSCTGVVALVPERAGGTTTPYILAEIAVARSLDLPVMLVVDDGLTGEMLGRTMEKAFDSAELFLEEPGNSAMSRAAREVEKALRANRGVEISVCPLKASAISVAETLSEAVQDFADTLRRRPEKPAHCFLGHVYRTNRDAAFRLAKRSIQSVAGMACSAGNDFQQDRSADPVQPNIIDGIKSATFSIFDVTDDSVPEPLSRFLAEAGEDVRQYVAGRSWALNTCVEAGIAMGAGIPVYFIARGPEREPVFMLKNHAQRVLW